MWTKYWRLGFEVSINQLKDNFKSFTDFNCFRHGDLLFIAYEEDSSVVADEPVPTKQANPNTAEAIFHNVKQLPLDDELDSKDGKILRPRDPKMCRHGDKGMCDYCMPLEPFDKGYQDEKNIKHLSFHSHLKQLNANANKTGSATSYMAPLSEPDYRVTPNCPSGHPPWPEGICSKCQPSAITLQQQSFRMVDHVEFSTPDIINTFIDSWRLTGAQRIGYLYGRYEAYENVPLGIKAVVEVIYEPSQHNESDGITLTLPWDDEKQIDKVAELCGLMKLGVIYTDLTDAGAGDGSVICKRHVDSYFLSSLEICFSAKLQTENASACRWSSSGRFSSKFVTCVISGNQKGEIDISSYQVSTSAEAMVKADLIEPSSNPSVMRIKEPTRTRYVPEIFYRKINEYKRAVQENAKPAFPVEYLIVTLTHGFPETSKPLFSGELGKFPIENRGHIGSSQDLYSLSRLLGLNAQQQDTPIEAVSDFHFLAYLLGLSILSPEEEKLLVKVALTHDHDDGYLLLQSPGWQALLTIIQESS